MHKSLWLRHRVWVMTYGCGSETIEHSIVCVLTLYIYFFSIELEILIWKSIECTKIESSLIFMDYCYFFHPLLKLIWVRVKPTPTNREKDKSDKCHEVIQTIIEYDNKDKTLEGKEFIVRSFIFSWIINQFRKL